MTNEEFAESMREFNLAAGLPSPDDIDSDGPIFEDGEEFTQEG